MYLFSFESIQSNYNDKLWTKEQVARAVACGKITADQYKLITGEDYVIEVK